MPRYEYQLDLHAYQPPNDLRLTDAIRAPLLADTEGLAALMINAYAGTIDYDGEALDDARSEVKSYFTGRSGAPLLAASRVLDADGDLAAACLVRFWEARGCPLIAYVMTGAVWKGRGLARLLLHQSLATLAANGQRVVRAVITEGNTPSERLLARAGFTRAS